MLSRLENRCSMGHTALFPGKTCTRADVCHEVDRKDDIITISHGALDTLCTLRHQGRILICDTDPGVITAAHYIRVGDPRNGKPGDYQGRLNLLEEKLGDIREGLTSYLDEYGAKDLGGLDLDLTGLVDDVSSNGPLTIMLDCLQILHNYQGSLDTMVFLTYRNGRDTNGRNGGELREETIRSSLPSFAKLVWHKPYRSDWIDRFAHREMGSSMAIAAVRIIREPSASRLNRAKLERAELAQARLEPAELSPANLWGTKLAVYNLLQENPRFTQWDIACKLGCSQPNVSYHMRDLRRQGYL
jgi:DNA-binding transcriptional ArsR family regulator